MSKPSICLIAAMTQDHIIGVDQTIPWDLPSDMRHFKATTMDHIVVMGRKTFVTMARKPLRGRTNIVVSTKDIPELDGDTRRSYGNNTSLLHAYTLESSLCLATRIASNTGQKIFVIGGGALYEWFLPHAQELIITHVDVAVKPTDDVARFPQVDWSQYAEVEQTSGCDNSVNYTVKQYSKV